MFSGFRSSGVSKFGVFGFTCNCRDVEGLRVGRSFLEGHG